MSTGDKSERPLIVGAGDVYCDFIGRMTRLPDPHTNTDNELDEISVQVGGTGAVSIATAAAMGCRTRFACKLADEFVGSYIVGALSHSGVETRGVLAKDRVLSGVRFRMRSQQGIQASVYSHGDVGDLGEHELDAQRLLDGANALLLDGRHPAAQLRLAKYASQRDIPVILDGGHLGPGLIELIKATDILLCSERFCGEFAPRDSLEDSLLDLQKLGPRAAVITLGSAGSVGMHGDKLVRQPAFPVDLVDDECAGAVYHGAFAAALLSELPFARCMEFASAAAGLSCSTLGAWAGIPERQAVLESIRRGNPN